MNSMETSFFKAGLLAPSTQSKQWRARTELFYRYNWVTTSIIINSVKHPETAFTKPLLYLVTVWFKPV